MTQNASFSGIDSILPPISRFEGEHHLQKIVGNADIAPCLTVVVPVYNEVHTIQQIIAHVAAQRPVQELIIVDDHSTDGTWEVLTTRFSGERKIRLFRHDTNQGKGAALRTGFKEAGSNYVIIQDADLEYDPTEYYMLL